jgi:hypothetical protein
MATRICVRVIAVEACVVMVAGMVGWIEVWGVDVS